ncbi:hypothetical protein EDD36DRAFT_329602 [Exophiala viscosa]|uniref:BTB domain-containing protein n=1 Tax=Exophiala viscosa TaxID=2486360 RepID=A0AAN6DQA0_9EURO|nr:hypothetical protein EDD36DRAFT_329602 [Exophiala viscosa]
MDLDSRPDPSQSQAEAEVAEDLFTLENDYEIQSFTASPVITVIVGPEKKIYKLHRKLLVEKSPFFDNCLNSRMKESFTNEVVLPEDSYRGFELVADWIYSEKVPYIEISGDQDDTTPGRYAYVLADKFCMPELQNALIDRLADYWTRQHIYAGTITEMADLVDEDGALYRLMIDELAHDIVKHSWVYKPRSDSCSENERPSFSKDWDGEWRGSLEKLLACPKSAWKLLWKVSVTKKADRDPAESPEKYHVSVDSKVGNSQVPGA